VISEGLLEERCHRERGHARAHRGAGDKDDLNDLGLLKVDLLALGMLTALKRAFTLVNDYRGTHHALGQLPARIRRFTTWSVVPTPSRVPDRVARADVHAAAPEAACYYDLVIEVAIVRPGPIQGDMVLPLPGAHRAAQRSR